MYEDLVMTDINVQAAVQQNHGAIARAAGQSGCCGPTPCGCGDPITSNLYSEAETQGLPADAVLREAFRVLKPGGRFAVSDVVVRGHVPQDIRRSVELRVGCIAGASERGNPKGPESCL
jgi:hypothetical protein